MQCALLLILVSLGHEDAVAAAVVHLDISPGNILIVGGQGILIDWGLSKWLKVLLIHITWMAVRLKVLLICLMWMTVKSVTRVTQ